MKRKSLDLQIFNAMEKYMLGWSFFNCVESSGDINSDFARAPAKEWWNKEYVHTNSFCKNEKHLFKGLLPEVLIGCATSETQMVLVY